MTVSATEPKDIGFARAMVVVFAPFACGYFFSYLYRSVNAVVAPNLRADIGVDAAELGLLSAAYLLSFALCQIPLGLLLDRFGPRRVQGILYAIAALGALLFAIGEDVATLIAARAIIGLGVSGGLMAALKAIVQWFPRRRIALVNGWYLAFGGLGALSATAPFEFALTFTDWRGLFVLLAAGTLAAAVLILFAVPDKPLAGTAQSLRESLAGLAEIYRDPYFWRITPLMFTGASLQMAIQGLWAGPWLSDVEGLTRASVANHLLLMAIGFILGTFLSGPYASALRRFGLSMSSICALSAALFVIVMLGATFRLIANTYVLWWLFGFVGIFTSLVFAALALHFPESHIGRANTAVNVFVFTSAFIYQYGIGAVVAMWPTDAAGHYPELAYVSAFLLAIATQVMALVWYVFLGWVNARSRA